MQPYLYMGQSRVSLGLQRHKFRFTGNTEVLVEPGRNVRIADNPPSIGMAGMDSARRERNYSSQPWAYVDMICFHH